MIIKMHGKRRGGRYFIAKYHDFIPSETFFLIHQNARTQILVFSSRKKA